MTGKYIYRNNRLIWLLFSVMLLLVFGSPWATAQENYSVSIRAMATVVEKSEIELVTIKNLDLDLNRAVDEQIIISAKTDPEAGNMLVKGKPGAHIRITYLPEMELVNTTGAGSLTVFYEVYGYPGDNQTASEPLDAVDRMMRINPEGHYYLWIGGRINVKEARPGNYEGEFTIEIEYI